MDNMNVAYVLDLFQAIADASNTLKGRFYTLKAPVDLNSNNLGQIFYDAIGGINLPDKGKFPGVFVEEPRMIKHNDPTKMGKSTMHIQMYFVTKANIDNTTKPNTPIPDNQAFDDLSRMESVALGFRAKLKEILSLNASLFQGYILENEMSQDYLTAIINRGQDRVSGFSLKFELLIYTGYNCTNSDYGDVVIPTFLIS